MRKRRNTGIKYTVKKVPGQGRIAFPHSGSKIGQRIPDKRRLKPSLAGHLSKRGLTGTAAELYENLGPEHVGASKSDLQKVRIKKKKKG